MPSLNDAKGSHSRGLADEEASRREELIVEIEALLNSIDTKHPSHFCTELVAELDVETLQSIRTSLLAKQGDEIAQNQEWLFGLVDS